MNKSDSIIKLSASLVKAQRNIGAASKGGKNPFFKSNYATLGDVMEACKDPLNAEGVVILQPILSDATGDYVQTTLLHESGEYITSTMKLTASKNMQEFGSAISYAKRYSLQSLVFIPASDDDGEGAMGRSSPPTQTKPIVEASGVTTEVKPSPWRKAKPTTESKPVDTGMEF